jgi:hypothetical protein
MRATRLSVALPLFVVMLATPVLVAAQDMLPAHEAEKDLADYADCVVKRKAYRKPVAEFLRVVPDSAPFYRASMKAADLTCLNDSAVRRRASKLEMRLQPATFRGALYPALYRRDYGKAGPPAGMATVAAYDLSKEFDGDVSALPADYAPGRAIGDCIARKAPQDVHSMLVSYPWSRGEDATITRLKPVLANCLPSQQTVRFSREALRAYLGEAAYKLALASSTSAA